MKPDHVEALLKRSAQADEWEVGAPVAARSRSEWHRTGLAAIDTQIPRIALETIAKRRSLRTHSSRHARSASAVSTQALATRLAELETRQLQLEQQLVHALQRLEPEAPVVRDPIQIWLDSHPQEALEYAGRYIAVDDAANLVAVGPDFDAISDQLDEIEADDDVTLFRIPV